MLNIKVTLLREQTTIHSRCLFMGHKLIVPPTLRLKLLREFHQQHSGVKRLKETSQTYYWWSQLNTKM